jgi:hypothetical protein
VCHYYRLKQAIPEIADNGKNAVIDQRLEGAPQTRVSIFTLRAVSASIRLDPLTLAPGRFGTESVYVPLATEMFAE